PNFANPTDGIVHPYLGAEISNATINAYIQHSNPSEGSIPPAHMHLHDISFLPASGYTSNGAVLNWAFGSEIDHLLGPFIDTYGLMLIESFEVSYHDNSFSGGKYCFFDENSAEST